MEKHLPQLAKISCPCNNQISYDDCCGLYISGSKLPPSPEILMRSRYTAYTRADISYIQATMCDHAAKGYDPVEAKRWAKRVAWQGLKVIDAFPHEQDPNCAYVSFVASYRFQGRMHEIVEVSAFKRRFGKWYYVGTKI